MPKQKIIYSWLVPDVTGTMDFPKVRFSAAPLRSSAYSNEYDADTTKERVAFDCFCEACRDVDNVCASCHSKAPGRLAANGTEATLNWLVDD